MDATSWVLKFLPGGFLKWISCSFPLALFHRSWVERSQISSKWNKVERCTLLSTSLSPTINGLSVHRNKLELVQSRLPVIPPITYSVNVQFSSWLYIGSYCRALHVSVEMENVSSGLGESWRQFYGIGCHFFFHTQSFT